MQPQSISTELQVLSQRLAQQNKQVSGLVDHLAQRVDPVVGSSPVAPQLAAIFSPANRHNGDRTAGTTPEDSVVPILAEGVRADLGLTRIRRGLVRLIGLCGASRQRLQGKSGPAAR